MTDPPRSRIATPADAPTALQDTDADDRRNINKAAVHQREQDAAIGSRHRQFRPWHVRSSVGMVLHSRPEQSACPTNAAGRRVRGLAILTETVPSDAESQRWSWQGIPKAGSQASTISGHPRLGPDFVGTGCHPSASFIEGRCRVRLHREPPKQPTSSLRICAPSTRNEETSHCGMVRPRIFLLEIAARNGSLAGTTG